MSASRDPQNQRDGSWYYEDERGITVVKEARSLEGKYIATTQARIPWSALKRSMKRCKPKP